LESVQEQTYTLRSFSQIEEIGQTAWDALIGSDDGAPETSPFVEYTWLHCLEEAGCVHENRGWAPHHLALYNQAEELIAALPLYLKMNSEGEFVFDWAWADASRRMGAPYYPKLVAGVPFTPASGARLLVRPDCAVPRATLVRLFADALRKTVDTSEVSSAHVLFPHLDEAQLWEDAGFIGRSGVQYQFHNPGYADFEAFLQTLPSKKRTQIRRERKQPERDGVQITTERELTAETIEAMHHFYGLTVDQFMYGRRYLNRKFFELVASRFAHRLAWVIARKDGKPIAGAFNVKKGKTLYGRYWGASETLPFLHFNVCYYHGVEECIREGLSKFEPGAGGEHKRVRGFAPTETFSAHYVKHQRLQSAVHDFVRRERAAIRDVVSGRTEDTKED
jgi:uncharacterized protein